MSHDWMLMFHGFAFGIYDHQGGRRGDDKFFSSNMGMLMAQHPLGSGTFGLRTMLSLEPATIGKEGYPLLLQTGETANGVDPLIDRQHPHDLFMELALSYSVPLSSDGSFFAYFGLPGEPALGPPAFMHRISGMEIPEAPITHHWLDSTHITYGVGTAGFTWKDWKWDSSIFTGREPDEKRWNFDKPQFDSYSTRLTYNPSPQWSLQASYGFLNSPEQLEPGVDTHRITASAAYHTDWEENYMQTMMAWGLNVNRPGRSLNAFTIESLLNLNRHHNVMGRVEVVTKDGLFESPDPQAGQQFNVAKLSLGYRYDLPTWHRMKWGVGGLGSVHILPDSLDPAYGETPLSFMVFTRVCLE